MYFSGNSLSYMMKNNFYFIFGIVETELNITSGITDFEVLCMRHYLWILVILWIEVNIVVYRYSPHLIFGNNIQNDRKTILDLWGSAANWNAEILKMFRSSESLAPRLYQVDPEKEPTNPDHFSTPGNTSVKDTAPARMTREIHWQGNFWKRSGVKKTSGCRRLSRV